MAHVLTLPENTHGRDFVIGDIHGAFTILGEALLAAQFDPKKDRLISVGDLIDRGPQSPAALLFLKQPWFFAVRGNHEDEFLGACNEDGSLNLEEVAHNLENGMGWVLDETPETLAELRAAFKKLPIAIEVPTSGGTVGFLHAEVPGGMDWSTFKKKIEDGDASVIVEALWGRKRVKEGDTQGVAGIDRIFCGHTIQQNGPQSLGNCYYVDTGSFDRTQKGDRAPEYMLTLCDITADPLAIVGPPPSLADKYKIVAGPPKKKKLFRKNGPSL